MYKSGIWSTTGPSIIVECVWLCSVAYITRPGCYYSHVHRFWTLSDLKAYIQYNGQCGLVHKFDGGGHRKADIVSGVQGSGLWSWCRQSGLMRCETWLYLQVCCPVTDLSNHHNQLHLTFHPALRLSFHTRFRCRLPLKKPFLVWHCL